MKRRKKHFTKRDIGKLFQRTPGASWASPGGGDIIKVIGVVQDVQVHVSEGETEGWVLHSRVFYRTYGRGWAGSPGAWEDVDRWSFNDRDWYVPINRLEFLLKFGEPPE